MARRVQGDVGSETVVAIAALLTANTGCQGP